MCRISTRNRTEKKNSFNSGVLLGEWIFFLFCSYIYKNWIGDVFILHIYPTCHGHHDHGLKVTILETTLLVVSLEPVKKFDRRRIESEIAIWFFFRSTTPHIRLAWFTKHIKECGCRGVADLNKYRNFVARHSRSFTASQHF